MKITFQDPNNWNIIEFLSGTGADGEIVWVRIIVRDQTGSPKSTMTVSFDEPCKIQEIINFFNNKML